ncbi:MAG: adenylate kinase [Candidatus Nanohaloarchaeota archaeon QJJ-5]|nr:adenylate kinase [Candidatus Nanohaloarchaeota archaeon QJJ-5]
MTLQLIMLGPPGAGKGTQAGKLADHFDIPHISTGQILRNNKDMETPYGTPRSYIEDGNLVPDEMMIEILEKRLQEDDTDDGYILDGFPRTRPQAVSLADITDIDAVIYLRTSEENILKRLTGRRTCEDCGRTYHIEMNPPPDDDQCESCGGAIVQRADDRESVVRDRLEEYQEKTKPLIEFYREKGTLLEIDGNPSIEEVWTQLKDRLDDTLDNVDTT